MSEAPPVVTIGVAQIACRLGDVPGNLGVCLDVLRRAADAGADLVVLPECALTGYVFSTAEDAWAAAIDPDGEELRTVAAEVERLRLHAVVGFLEGAGTAIHNSAALIGPQGPIGLYRKTHIPPLGVDRFVRRGSSLNAVWETPVGRIGISICYDIRFPECARLLALRGADIVAQPSNIPVGSPEIVTDQFVRVRACENSIFLALANRCDEEGAYRFCGKSSIVAPDGGVLASAGAEPALILAEADVRLARTKSRELVSDAKRFTVELLGDRRPDLYGTLTAKTGERPSVPESVEERRPREPVERGVGA